MKKSHSKRLHIPCFFEEPKPSALKLSSNTKSKLSSAYNSSKNSPNSSCLGKAKKTLKSKPASKLSPRGLASCQNSPPRDSKTRLPRSTIKKNKPKKPAKKEEKLCELKGGKIKYAPKIFENQVFLDVYDELGRHDRVMEIQNTFSSDRSETPVIIFNGEVVNNFACEELAPPGNSFEETYQDSKNLLKNLLKDDLFAKLEKMAREQLSTEE